MRVLIENVRSFCGTHSIPLRPLTLLIGENSTGKSTFLAIVAHVFGRRFPSFRPVFNLSPFDLGSFDSIATYKGGKFGRAETFSLGFESEKERPDILVRCTYSSDFGQPQLSGLDMRSKKTVLRLDTNTKESGQLTISDPGMSRRHFSIDLKRFSGNDLPIPMALERVVFDAAPKAVRRRIILSVDRLIFALYQSRARKSVLALAPVRTKPRRTYDQISDDFKPEGDHIPVILARMGHRGEAEQSRLAKALSGFGKASSLFKEISVKPLGKRPSDPFQLFVSVAGPAANLSDVGYGVSQSLPIIVQSVLAEEGLRILLQQPEVHLHPRGQAALGSFFAHLVGDEKKELLIETHSDYLIDRIRLEVAQGTVSANDVLLLYFEKSGVQTKVHEITLDKRGNILNAPSSYRNFFLHEETRLLRRASN